MESAKRIKQPSKGKKKSNSDSNEGINRDQKEEKAKKTRETARRSEDIDIGRGVLSLNSYLVRPRVFLLDHKVIDLASCTDRGHLRTLRGYPRVVFP